MLIFGSRAANLITLQSNNAICPSCQTKGSIVISVYSRHVHIFWIPIFPIGKAGASQCQHCKLALNDDQMPEDIRKDYFTLSGTKKVPMWQFSGTALISIIVIFNIFSSSQTKNRYDAYFSNPLIGDVYVYHKKNGNISSFKISQITNDSLYGKQNRFETNGFAGINQIDKDENYSESESVISRVEIKKMYLSSKIVESDRK
jgi:hypothetical protein